MPRRGGYTEDEDNFIRSHYLTMRSRDIGVALGRPERSIAGRIATLGLHRFRTIPFSPEEDEAIRNGFGRPSTDIAKRLGRAPSVIRTRARRLGLGRWKRGYKDFRGYKVVALADGARRIPEHRFILAGTLGRELDPNEFVHHINFNKRDNRVENLHLCVGIAAHSRTHYSLYKLVPLLLDCGYIRFNRAEGIYEICETDK